MKQYNRASNFLAKEALELKLANKYELQKLFYQEMRSRFNVNSQFVIRIIGKVSEAYKKYKSIQPRFRPNGAFQYDQRNLTWKNGIDSVSLITLNGRIKLATRVGEYQRERAGGLRGQADLIYRNHVFYLIALIDVEEEESRYDVEGTLGIDLGIENLAIDSDGEIFSGEQAEKIRHRYFVLRSKLQNVRTRNAKREAQDNFWKRKTFQEGYESCYFKMYCLESQRHESTDSC